MKIHWNQFDGNSAGGLKKMMQRSGKIVQRLILEMMQELEATLKGKPGVKVSSRQTALGRVLP